MSERPLLLFPSRKIADRTKRGFAPNGIRRPSHKKQGKRLAPIFEQLQKSFDSRSQEIRQTPTGVEPEQVLVIETIGSVVDFFKAVKHIEGLEWEGELEVDEIAPDDDFYDENNPQKTLAGHLYLIMSNHTALVQMLSLWNYYVKDENFKFKRGLAKFREVFKILKNIRRWEVVDRVSETGLIEVWREELQINHGRPLRFEIELWFRNTKGKRIQAYDQLKQSVEYHGGKILAECIIAEIGYHALMAEIPPTIAEEVIHSQEIELIKCDAAMFFRPTGQMSAGKVLHEGDLLEHAIVSTDNPSGEPVVAMLDGLPLENHRLLDGRLLIDDPDNYAAIYPSTDRIHGTAMASLISHGDLNDGSPPLTRPIYVRPIMKPPISSYKSPKPEQIPDDVIFTDLIHRAVRRIFDGDGSNGAVAPSIRVINFSIGDLRQPFLHSMSSLARLLDWLSVKYRVLFVISAGNHKKKITTDLSMSDFDNLSETRKEAVIIKALYSDIRHRKIFAPAESINGITVGALHDDEASFSQNSQVMNLFQQLLPSSISAFGNGYRRAIKPDILIRGGRVLHHKPLGTDADFEPLLRRSPPGVQAASPGVDSGDLGKTAFSCGTSNATALASRMVSECYDVALDVF